MEEIALKSKKCFVFDEHHQVIEAWYNFHKERKISPLVITLDHHTDVLRAFNYQFLTNPNFIAKDNLSIQEAIELLHHDEHIDYAISKGYISQSIIISHTNSDKVANEKIEILTDNFFDDEISLNSPELKIYFDSCLDDDFLGKFIKDIPQEPYILDIDLDYFKSLKSLAPQKHNIFDKLIENCEFITISREEIWVKLLSFETKNKFNSSIIIDKLLRF